MSVWLTLFLSIFAVIGMFGGAFFLVTLLLEARKKRASPKMSIMAGEGGGLGVLVKWDVSAYAAQFYRASVSFYSPEHQVKEGRFSVTFPAPQKKPFFQTLQFPDRFKTLMAQSDQARAIVSVSVRSIEELMLDVTMPMARFVKLMGVAAPQLSKDIAVLPSAIEDKPDVSSLDHEEYVARKSKLDILRSQAKAKEAAQQKAKAAAAAPKPADKPVTTAANS